ncbi:MULTISPECIES: hypothetical protein [Lactococcus]|jgi:hypothetical protein|uniref:hypothetical protein n=1 Tax=Lactococcus TaxID=1357 RepID=UPI001680B83C|nr:MULTISPECIES: hypothetical protein [Lactococcus]
MDKSEKSKGLTPSYRYIPKGILTGKKYKNTPFGTSCSNGFFAYFEIFGGCNDL